MSESLSIESVSREIQGLVELADTDGVTCADFSNQQIFPSTISFAGPSLKSLMVITVPDNGGLVVVRIDVRVDTDITDTTLVPAGQAVSDLRSTDSLNPYGPFAGGGSTFGVFIFNLNDSPQFGQNVTPIGSCPDFALMNVPIMFAYSGPAKLELKANPNQPAGKNLALITRMIAYPCTLNAANGLKKKSTQIVVPS